MNRRDLLKNAGIGATFAAATVVGSGSLIETAAAQTAAPSRKSGRKFKVIDMRCRPPLPQYAGLYKMRRENLQMGGRPNTLANPATMGDGPPLIAKDMAGKPGAMEEYWKEVDKAGIDIVATNGRYAAGIPSMTMDNDGLLKLQKEYKGRFLGYAMLNTDIRMEETMADLERALAGGLRGAALEPGYRTKNGGATTIDNADFYPIIETMIAADLPLFTQTGPMAGVYDWHATNELWRFDALMNKFPRLKLVLVHGGYLNQTAALALATKHPNVVLMPDVYTFWPGGQIYQQNLEILQDQFIYASAFPFADMDTSLKLTLELPVSDEVMAKYLSGNVSRIMNL